MGALRRSKSVKSGGQKSESESVGRSNRGKVEQVIIDLNQRPSHNRNAVRRSQGAPVLSEYVEMLESLPDKKFIDQTWFCILVCIETCLCLLSLGLQADYECHGHECTDSQTLRWFLVDYGFTAIAVFEILFGLCSQGRKAYFIGRPRKGAIDPEGAFHCFDTLLVFCRFLDLCVLSPLGYETNLKLLSAFRVMHIGWFASQFQLVKLFRELWLIMAGMLDTLKTVVWVVLLLALLLWVFAIMLTILVNDGTVFNYSKVYWKKDDLWGTVPKSLFTLLQTLTSDGWGEEIFWPLVEANILFLFIFLLFFIVGSLALMNTVVGAVVESTLRSSKLNEERNKRERQRIDQQLMSSLERVFNDADTDGNGELDRRELWSMTRQLHVKKTITMLNLRGRDLDGLFTILDTENEGTVLTERFFRGCSRLPGNAMARDLETLGNDFLRTCEDMDANVGKIKTANDTMSDIVDLLEMAEKQVVRYEGDSNDPVVGARRERQHISATERFRTVHHVLEEVGTEGTSEVYHSDFEPAAAWIERQPHPPPLPRHLGEINPSMAWEHENAEIWRDIKEADVINYVGDAWN